MHRCHITSSARVQSNGNATSSGVGVRAYIDLGRKARVPSVPYVASVSACLVTRGSVTRSSEKNGSFLCLTNTEVNVMYSTSFTGQCQREHVAENAYLFLGLFCCCCCLLVFFLFFFFWGGGLLLFPFVFVFNFFFFFFFFWGGG